MSDLLADPRAEDAPDAEYRAVVDRTRDLATRVLAPRANQTDQAEGPPADNFRHLAQAGLLGLTIPRRYGGQGAPGPVVRACTELLAAACGVTTFVLSRHLLACRQIAGSANEALKAELLPQLAAGARLCARGTTHVRREGPPVLRAEPEGAGWVFNGTAPWVSGWGLMQEVVLGGTLPDGRLVYVVVPLVESEAMQPSPPMRLCAMNASATVSLTCRNLRVGPERYLGTQTRLDLAWVAGARILGRTTGPFAVATASVALLRELAQARGKATIAATAEALEHELAAARREARHWAGRVAMEGYWANALRVAAWSHELSVRAAHAAVAAAGGRANDRDHVAQRLFREAMFYTLYLQTHGVQAATLQRLADGAARAVAESGGREARVGSSDESSRRT